MQGTQSWCSVTTRRDEMGREVQGGFKMEGTQVYLWLIYTDVLQKPSQHCKVTILQLKSIIFFKNFKKRKMAQIRMLSSKIEVNLENYEL